MKLSILEVGLALIFIILLALNSTAQTPKRMVVVPDYSIDQETKVQQRVYNQYSALPSYTVPTYSQDIFVIGNFNRVNVIRPMINVPDCTVDNNNYEYVKTTQFNPNKSLSEILRNE